MGHATRMAQKSREGGKNLGRLGNGKKGNDWHLRRKMEKRGVGEKNCLHLKLDCNARQWSQHTLGRLRHRGDAHGTRAVAWGEALRGRRGLRTGAQNKPACRDRTLSASRGWRATGRASCCTTHIGVGPLLSWATSGLLC